MKKILYTFILISFITCSEKKTTHKNFVPEKEMYSIINFIIETELTGINSHNIYVSEEFPLELPNSNFFGIEELSEILSEKDVAFMKLQLERRFDFRINQNSLKNRKVISFDSLSLLYNPNERSDTFWERFEKKYKAQQFDAVSLPLFSVDFKTVMVSYGTHCGSLCGTGATAIYRKTNRNWKRIKSMSFWKS